MGLQGQLAKAMLEMKKREYEMKEIEMLIRIERR